MVQARVFLPVFVVALLAVVPGAEAWTRTRVTAVRADVDATSGDRSVLDSAAVTLTVDLEITGGWLSEFEIEGIDADPASLPTTAGFISIEEPFTRFTPSVTRTETGVALSFERKHAPHRGRYRVTLPFRTTLARSAVADGDDVSRARVSWTLPAWETALEDVRVTMRLPKGASPAPIAEELRDAVITQRRQGRETSDLEWVRVHLPQTVAWSVEADVHAGIADTAPASSAILAAANDAGTGSKHAVSAAKLRPRGPTAPAWPVLGAAFVTLLLALLKLRGTANLYVQQQLTIRHAVPMAMAARVTLLLCTTVTAAWAHAIEPRVALGALAFAALLVAPRRARITPPVPSLGAFRTVDDIDIARARRMAQRAVLGVSHPADITTVAGIALFGLFLSLAFASAPTYAALWFVPAAMLIMGTRMGLPRTAEERLIALLEHGPVLPGQADDLVVFETHGGHFQDARRRLSWGATGEALMRCGLLHVDLAMGPASGQAAITESPFLVAVTDRDSDAEQVARGMLTAVAESRTRRAFSASFTIGKAEAVRAALLSLCGQRAARLAVPRGTRPRAKSSTRRAA